MCKDVRRELKLSQRELGVLIRSNQTEISFIERGFTPSKSKVTAIKNLYDMINNKK